MDEGRSEKLKYSSKQHPCQICGKIFSSKKDLTRHERVHTGEKPFKCNICVKTFSQRSTLTDHKKIHTGETSYKCDICEKVFNHRSTLAVHKRIHTGEKPYECDVCEKSFSHSNSLVRHKMSHTAEKPDEGDICKKTFTRKDNLNVHKIIHSCELLRHDKTTDHLNISKGVRIDSSSNLNDYDNCEVETIKKEINNDESVDDPHPIHQETENKDEDLYDYDRIDIEEFKIAPGDVNINEESSDQNNINNVNVLVDNTDLCSTTNSFVECSESIKLENIKKGINKEEIVEDPLYVQQNETFDNSNLNDSVALDDSTISNDINVEDSEQNNSFEVNNLLDNVEVNNMVEEGNNDVNNIEENVNEVEENVIEVEGNVNEAEGNGNEVEGNVNEVEGNVVGQENINFQALQNLSVDEALAFFSS